MIGSTGLREELHGSAGTCKSSIVHTPLLIVSKSLNAWDLEEEEEVQVNRNDGMSAHMLIYCNMALLTFIQDKATIRSRGMSFSFSFKDLRNYAPQETATQRDT